MALARRLHTSLTPSIRLPTTASAPSAPLAETRQRRIGLCVAAMRQYRLGRQAAGPFAGLQPAHAVRQNEQIQLRRQPEAVFVVLANTPCIAARANFHRTSPTLPGS